MAGGKRPDFENENGPLRRSVKAVCSEEAAVSEHDRKTLAGWGMEEDRSRNLKVQGVENLYLKGTLRRACWLLRQRRGHVSRSVSLGNWPGMGVASAIHRAEDLSRQLADGIPLSKIVIEGRMTLRDAIGVYRNFAAGQIHVKKRAARLSKELGKLADWPLSRIRVSDLQRVIDQAAEHSRASAITIGGTARAMLKMAADRGWTMENPSRLKLPLLASRRELLEEPDLSAIFVALPALAWQFHAGTLFQAATGCRLSEAFSVAWADVDTEKRRWNAPATKMKLKQSHSLWLNDTALFALAIAHTACPDRSRGYVFSDRPFKLWAGYGRSKGALKRAIKWPAGERLVLHDLRRSIRKLPDVVEVDSAVGDMILAHSLGRERASVDASYNVRIWDDEIRKYLTTWDGVLKRCGALTPRPGRSTG